MARVSNDVAEFAVITLNDEDKVRNTILGDTTQVSQELADIVENIVQFNVWVGRNEYAELFAELVSGGDAGIDGVELIGLDADSFTLGFTNNNAVTDTIVFEGTGIATIISDLADQFDGISAVNGVSDFDVVDLSAGFTTVNKPGNYNFEVRDLTQGQIDQATEIANIISELIVGDGIFNVELIDVDQNSFAVALNNINDDSVDTLLFTGAEAVAGIAALNAIAGDVNVLVPDNNFEIMTVTEFGFAEAIGQTEVVGNGEFAQVVNDIINGGGAQDFNRLIQELTTGNGGGDGVPGIDDVALVGVDGDSLTLAIGVSSNTPDYLVLDLTAVEVA